MATDDKHTDKEKAEPAVVLPKDRPAAKALEAAVKDVSEKDKEPGPENPPEPPRPKKSDEMLQGVGQDQQQTIQLKLQHYDLTARAARIDLEAEVLEQKAAAARAQASALRTEASLIVRNLDIQDSSLNTAISVIKELSAETDPVK